MNKRKQDLLQDSNLWINQLHIKNPKLPALPIAIASKKWNTIYAFIVKYLLDLLFNRLILLVTII